MALRRKLTERIEDAFGRWDDANGRPERQGGRERGVSDPWMKDVGNILAAWYDWKTLLAERDRILDRERQLDDVTVVVERGAEPTETISVGPDPAAGQATARVRGHAGGITLSVESGDEDVDALFSAIASDRGALATQLAACNAASPQAARERADRNRDSTAAAASRKAVHDGLLQDKSFEQWETEVQAVESLPATRDPATIDGEIARITKQLADGAAQAEKHAESITNWTTQYEAPETLTTRLLEAKAAVQAAETKLASLPGLPEGYGSVKAFLDALDSAQQELNPKQ